MIVRLAGRLRAPMGMRLRDWSRTALRLAGWGRAGDGVDRQLYFPQTFAAFVLVLVTLTGVIWITQALRGIDVMTSQGQTIVWSSSG